MQKPPPQIFELKGLVIVDLQPNPHSTEAPQIVAVLANGHSHEEPNVVLLYDVAANIERRRFRGLQADGTAPLTGKRKGALCARCVTDCRFSAMVP